MDITYYVACTVDGYIATPEGGVDWLTPFHGDDDYGFSEMYRDIDGILMGSGTYEFALQQKTWPSKDKPSWVFTGRSLPLPDPTVTLTSVEPAKVVEELTSTGMKRLWLMGGGKLATSFRASGLITDYMIFVIPVVLGEGIPLLAAGGHLDHLDLIESQSYPNGIVRLHYQSA